MSYIESCLIGDEKIIQRGIMTKWALLPWIFWGVLIALFTYGLGLLIIPFGYIMLRSNEAAVTDKRLIAKTGLIRRDTIEIPLAKVSSLQVRQGLIARMLGYGSLIISDTGNTYAPIHYIRTPLEFRRCFFMQQELHLNNQHKTQ